MAYSDMDEAHKRNFLYGVLPVYVDTEEDEDIKKRLKRFLEKERAKRAA